MLIPYFLGRDFLNAVLINISCPIHHENTRLESKKCFLVLVDTFNCISTPFSRSSRFDSKNDDRPSSIVMILIASGKKTTPQIGNQKRLERG
jgi:hypothetical protein